MRKEYDLRKLKWKSNPYAKFLKKPVTIRMDQDVVEYFKGLAKHEQVPYQTLINQFLRFCKDSRLMPYQKWQRAA